jgi:hypothetical protein
VVGTSIAAEGIPVINGKTMFVADDLQGLVDNTVRLLGDDQVRCQVSQSARQFVEQTYSWVNTYGRIHGCLEAARRNYFERRSP